MSGHLISWILRNSLVNFCILPAKARKMLKLINSFNKLWNIKRSSMYLFTGCENVDHRGVFVCHMLDAPTDIWLPLGNLRRNKQVRFYNPSKHLIILCQQNASRYSVNVILYVFLVTVKAAPHKCVITTGQR